MFIVGSNPPTARVFTASMVTVSVTQHPMRLPCAASGPTWPTVNLRVAPENRPFVISADFAHAPFLTGRRWFSISRMPVQAFPRSFLLWMDQHFAFPQSARDCPRTCVSLLRTRKPARPVNTCSSAAYHDLHDRAFGGVTFSPTTPPVSVIGVSSDRVDDLTTPPRSCPALRR
jgi:hypothetical protein